MNVQALVANAIYRSLQDKQQQPTLNAGYKEWAIFELNNILDLWKDFIPFSQVFTFNSVDELTTTSFVSVSNVNYIYPTNLSVPLELVTLTRFEEIKIITNLNSPPQVYYFDELTQTVLVYPNPNQPGYRFKVWGRIAQQPLEEFDPLPDNMPRFMIDAVTWELAGRLAAFYNVPWNEGKERQRQMAVDILFSKRDLDMSEPRSIVFPNPNSTPEAPFPYWYYLSNGGA